MRYRLRTLLIVLAVAPVALAGVWLFGKYIASNIVWLDIHLEVPHYSQKALPDEN